MLVEAGQMEEEGGRQLTEQVLQHHHQLSLVFIFQYLDFTSLRLTSELLIEWSRCLP